MWKYVALVYVILFIGITIYETIYCSKGKTLFVLIIYYLSCSILLAYAYCFWLGSFHPLFDKFAIPLCILAFAIEAISHYQIAQLTLKENPESTFKKELTNSIIGSTLFYIPLFYWMIAYTLKVS